MNSGVFVMLTSHALALQYERWSSDRAAAWMNQQPWRLGTNYLPSTAANVLEMWDARNFTKTLRRSKLEFDIAKGLGYSTMRIFLHENLFHEEGLDYLARVDQFLEVMKAAGLGAVMVLFDAVWRPDAEGAIPIPRVHNSAWVQCPTHKVLRAYGDGDVHAVERLQRYVEGVVSTFKDDDRVLVWDLYNEPSMFISEHWLTPKLMSRNGWLGPPTHWLWDAEKLSVTLKLLLASFGWARGMSPSQPLTAGVWTFPADLVDQSDPHVVFFNLQLALSDIVSFHCYCSPEELMDRIEFLQQYGRPLILTEFAARTENSTYQNSLPILHKNRIWGYAWGFVRGRSQTEYAWSTWATPEQDLVDEPPTWFHDLLHEDGTPYDVEEAKTIWWHTIGLNMPKL